MLKSAKSRDLIKVEVYFLILQCKKLKKLKLVKAHNTVRYSEANQLYTNGGANNDNGTSDFILSNLFTFSEVHNTCINFGMSSLI